ncbi:beta-galactosidase [Aestuariibaculum suncheonense]|uniref:Beta-galactosidase n=1 Tax=Aestuariibaculum suncheonense TaxID=1028745 RepID=A0A8J6Q714_9FLAO|nr:beta-galactosidase [Aestuariibaculum suncheonense]
MNKSVQIALLLVLPFFCIGQSKNTYSLNIDVPEKKITTGHLDLGGTNPSGEKIDVNSYYITLNGKPFVPVLGEFHYSRYPSTYWEESIQKMKAGGINVIATYVFWNIHERTEGVFDWSNDLNLRRFIELCEKNDIYLIVRMGPFCHGEMRNGGIPDWMYGRTFEVRSNNEEYFAYVDKLYEEIGKQCHGLLYKDGGPIIGVQLENEFQSSAAPWEITYPKAKKEYTVAQKNAAVTHEQISHDNKNNLHGEEGKAHMATLKKIAIKHGIDVPLYTATGWSNAAIVDKGSIPVTAGYVYPFWTNPSPSSFYLFKDIHKTPDYSPASYNTELYPSIPAEIGPGIQVIYGRRPIVDPVSVLPLMVRIIGSGSNGIGYYMYHGGSTPIFDGKFYNEEVNGIPKVNYDFQAPIGQYGQTRYHYNSLKTLHMFLDAYGEKLAPMQTVLPKTNADIKPENTETLRYAVRSKNDSGFLFMINFQDHLEYSDINNTSVEVKTVKETIRFPNAGTFDLKKTVSAIFPFNLKLGNTTLKSATVQPLTILNAKNKNYYVFYSLEGITPELLIDGGAELTKVQNASRTKEKGYCIVRGKNKEVFSFQNGKDEFIVIPYEMALKSTKIGDQLIFSEGTITSDGNQLSLVTRETNSQLHFYPDLNEVPKISFATLEKAKPMLLGGSSYKVVFEEPAEPIIQIKQVTDRKYSITTTGKLDNLNDVYLEVDYVGDRGMAFVDGLLVTDHFYHESKWEIGMKSFLPKLAEKEMVLIFHPLYKNQECLIFFSNLPEFIDGKFLKVKNIKSINEYKAIMSF